MAARSQLTLALLMIAVSVGLSVALTTTLQTSTRVSTEPASVIDPARFTALEARLAKLEETLERRAADLHAAAVPERSTERRPIDREDDVLSLSLLEQRLAALEQQMPPVDPHTGPRDVPVPPFTAGHRDRDQEIAAAKATITDPRKSAKDKLEAHRALRRVKDAYTSAMVQEMVRIGRDDPDPNVRAQVWCFFDGSSAPQLPQLVPHLLATLRHDTSGYARHEAAETLGNYPGDSEVVSALEFAIANDRDPDVRNKALRALLEIQPDADSVRELRAELERVERARSRR